MTGQKIAIKITDREDKRTMYLHKSINKEDVNYTLSLTKSWFEEEETLSLKRYVIYSQWVKNWMGEDCIIEFVKETPMEKIGL